MYAHHNTPGSAGSPSLFGHMTWPHTVVLGRPKGKVDKKVLFQECQAPRNKGFSRRGKSVVMCCGAIDHTLSSRTVYRYLQDASIHTDGNILTRRYLVFIILIS